MLATDKCPYYAGIVERVEGDHVYVFFPSQYENVAFKYERKSVIPYRSQFDNGKFQPLKPVTKLQRTYKRKLILTYENNVNNYIHQYI